MPARPTCPYCGATLSAGARYCDRCGTPLNHTTVNAPPLRRRIYKEHRVAVWVLLTAIFLLFSVGSVGGYWFRAGHLPTLPVTVSRTDPGLSGKTSPNLNQVSQKEIGGYLRAVVAISGKDHAGTGFIIDGKGHVVTAQHVVDGTGCVTVIDDDGRQHQGTVLNYDMGLDVAVLHVPGLENWTARLEISTDATPAQLGEEAYVIGHPRSTGNTTPLVGRVTKLDIDKQADTGQYHQNLLEVGDVAVLKGASGGPLILKSTGKAIGMMIMSGHPSPLAWARPTRDIAQRVEAWAKLTPSTECHVAPPAQKLNLTLVTVTPRAWVEGEELADGAELALRDAYEGLRRVGYEVSIKRVNDEGKPDKAREGVLLALQDPSVIGVVGSLENQTTRALAEALATSGLPMVAPTAGAEDLTSRGWPHFNRVVANNNRQNPVLANFAKELLQVSNVFILEDGSPDAAAQVRSFSDGAAVIGLPIAGVMKVTAAQDPVELKKRLSEARAEAIYYTGNSSLALHLVRSLRANDVMLPFLGNQDAFAETAFKPYMDAGAKGIYFTRLTAEPADQLSRKYEQTFGKPMRGYAGYGYDAALVILEALRKYGETHNATQPSPAELARLVRETRGLTGWSAPISFETNGENQTPWVHVFEWQKGNAVHTALLGN